MHLLALMLGCGEMLQSVTIPFSAEVNGEPFACGQSYEGLGTTAATISPQDFRVYVHDVALIDASGAVVPVTLDEDGAWQHEGLALLDFEDGSAGCKTGSPATHKELTGTVPPGDYTGLSFTVGVPDAMNHLDAATAPAPLNAPGMWWAWTSGFKFARIDVATDNNPAFYFHLGATSCSGSPGAGFACTLENLPQVTLDAFDPDADTVALDIAALYADNDLNAPIDYVSDFVNGCMAFEGDPECVGMLGSLGLGWGDAAAPASQALFAVEAR